MNKIFFLILAISSSIAVHAVELYNSANQVSAVLSKGSPLDANATLAGYPIYKGDGKWQFDGITSNLSGASGDATAINRVMLSLKHYEPDGVWFASMTVVVNTTYSGVNTYWTGSPCGGSHIFISNKSNGLYDNCATIDAIDYQSGTSNATYFRIKVTNTKSGGRMYAIVLDLNPNMFGFRGVSASQITPENILNYSGGKDFFEKIKTLSVGLQDATEKAMEYSKPISAFEAVPSFRNLMDIPVDLVDDKFTQLFRGAVVYAKRSNPYSAIAYTNYGDKRTYWYVLTGKSSKGEAEQQALDNCNKGRPANTNNCILYDLGGRTQPITVSPSNGRSTEFVTPVQSDKPLLKTLEERLVELKVLYEKGLISKSIYDDKRTEILKGL